MKEINNYIELLRIAALIDMERVKQIPLLERRKALKQWEKKWIGELNRIMKIVWGKPA